MLALVKAPSTDGRGIGVEPRNDIAAFVSGSPALLDLDDAGNFDREIVRGPLEREAFKFGSAEICEPIEGSDRKTLT